MATMHQRGPVRRSLTRLAASLLAVLTLGGVGVIAPSPADAAVRKTVTSDYTLLRRGPASYVVGTAYRGWTVDVHGDQRSGYRWGRVYGDLNTCLWTFSAVLSGDAGRADSCPGATTLPTSSFTNGQISSGAVDGTTVATVAGPGCATWNGTHITGYGNVRPWDVPAVASAPIAGDVAIGQTVRWRYVSRDGAWVMIRDPRSGRTDGVGQQSWYFIPRSCLPAILPG